MPQSPTATPRLDPAPIFEHYRGVWGTALLSAAISEFNVFQRLAQAPRAERELVAELNLSPRAGNALLVTLKAMGLLAADASGRIGLTQMAREHLLAGGEFYVGDYVSQVDNTEPVRQMVERLRTNRPAGAAPQEQGVAFLYREGLPSAMEQEAAARKLTLALAGRAQNVAPVLAERVPLTDANVLLDVGGGTGIYSVACLKRYPKLRAVVWDRPLVLKVAKEFAAAAGVADRLRLEPGDMFVDPVPAGCDAVLLSNILHDWDIPECRALVARLAAGMPAGGRLLIHDAFLNDALDGPLPVALYSANLFCVTEGRCYSAAECKAWCTEAGLTPGELIPTLIHCSVLTARK